MPEAQEAIKEDNIMVDLDTTGKAVDAVSYTHLTLPTIYSV